MKPYLLLALLLVGCGQGVTQTLQHHQPSDLHPESCQDHITRTRHAFQDASKVATEPVTYKDLQSILKQTSDGAKIHRVCEINLKDYNVRLAVAEYVIALGAIPK